MSWPLASFAIVLGVLLAGWLAYERSRPSARMAAVVATLAAVAALGRDAFVALPDVKPITAMTLVVGYSLGSLPGFAVGAIGMLASNIFLGQGPYTPWQMAAWGLVGLAGAALGRLSGRKAGRLTLALACAATAMGAKEIMNVYTWTIGASHSPAALLATAGQGLPYDVADTVASFLFGLAFAPELARLLGRLRARMDVRWQAAAAPLTLLAACLLVAPPAHAGARSPASGGHAKTSRAHAAAAAASLSPEVGYLTRAQNSDGGFGGAPGQRSSELDSAWAAIGLAAAGRDPLGLARGGRTVLDSIRSQSASLEGAGDVERTILALRACGASIAGFPGDLLGKLVAARTADGSFGHLVNITTFAILALRASGRPASAPVVHEAARWLAAQQNADGGFGFAGRGGGEDVDDTAAALQGLVDAGVRHGAIVAHAVGFLRRSQNLDGGFPQQAGERSNAQSTAWAIQGLTAAGQNPGGVERGGSRSPLAYLRSLVAGNGSVRYSPTSTQTPVWVTAEALAALAGRPLPVGPVSHHSHRSAHVSGVVAAGTRSGAADRSSPAAPSPRSPRVQGGAAGQSAKSAAKRSAESQVGEDALAREAGVVIGIVLLPVLR